MSKIIRNERASTINGIEGRAHNVVAWDNQHGLKTLANQKWSTSKEISGRGYGLERVRLSVELRFDDNCRNGHNSFAITASIDSLTGRDIAGGCLHDEIAKHYPALAHLIKWHLCATDGPMHYLANTTYHASDRDSSGRAKGEPSAFSHGVRFGNSPVTHRIREKLATWIKARIESSAAQGEFRVTSIAHSGTTDYKFGPKFTLVGYGTQWHECPFDSEQEANEFAQALNTLPVEFVVTPTAFSEGKARDLQAARNCAVWQEATDEQLSAPKDELKATLSARLPALVAAFRADIENAGFLWSAEI